MRLTAYILVAMFWCGVFIHLIERDVSKYKPETKPIPDFVGFPDYVGMDDRGGKINCSMMLAATSSTNGNYKFENYFVDRKHEYSQCKIEVERYFEIFCEKTAIRTFEELLQNKVEYTLETVAHLELCENTFTHDLTAYQSSYFIEPTENRYIEFPDDGVVVRPESIEEIVYWSTSYMHGLDFHYGENQSVTLRFGDAEKFENAKLQFVDIAFTKSDNSL